MKRSEIFNTAQYKDIQDRILVVLKSQPDYLSARTATSTRAAGDAMQDILCEHFESILGDVCNEYSSTFARRAMADLAFTDHHGFYYLVDVKTHRLGTAFNMPNLTSVERIARFYEDDANYFVVLMIKYEVTSTKVNVQRVSFVPIEFLSWECLTIGALGWGQIQIANANTLILNEQQSRKAWMMQMCDTLLDFYPKEIIKANKRIAYFASLRDKWSNREE